MNGQFPPHPYYSYQKRKWNPKFKLLSFSFPEKADNSWYPHRKYYIRLTYLDEGKKKRTKTVYFGITGVVNKVDEDKEKGIKQTPFRKQRSSDDYFHPYFWQDILLNSQDTIEDAFYAARKKLMSEK